MSAIVDTKPSSSHKSFIDSMIHRCSKSESVHNELNWVICKVQLELATIRYITSIYQVSRSLR